MLESKRKAIIFISLSLLLAAIAGFMFLQKVKALNTNLGEMAEVYVAAKDIPSRTVIQYNDVKTKEVPRKFVTESHITDKSKLSNRISKVALSEGDLITDNMLKEVQQVRDEDKRLVGIYASDRVRFNQQLEAFDRVDIIVSRKTDGKPVTEIFMENVPVSGVLSSKEGKGMVGILVEVSPEKATDLIHKENFAHSIRVLKANAGKLAKETEEIEDKEKSEGESSTKSEKEKSEKKKKDKSNDKKEGNKNNSKDKKEQKNKDKN